jgi:hypothetical protein
MEILYEPWPWYVAGFFIGLMVPLLLLLGNKTLGISSTMRQICAACYPAGIPLLNYAWKKESWNLFFVAGLVIGGWLGGKVLANPEAIMIQEEMIAILKSKGLLHPQDLMPHELFNWQALLTLKGFLLMVVGGFLVGFGTRYARGCTSGHGILGLSALQWPSLLAIVSFFIGGILCTHFILPLILAL